MSPPSTFVPISMKSAIFFAFVFYPFLGPSSSTAHSSSSILSFRNLAFVHVFVVAVHSIEFAKELWRATRLQHVTQRGKKALFHRIHVVIDAVRIMLFSLGLHHLDIGRPLAALFTVYAVLHALITQPSSPASKMVRVLIRTLLGITFFDEAAWDAEGGGGGGGRAWRRPTTSLAGGEGRAKVLDEGAHFGRCARGCLLPKN